jgi:CO/xanthine dehydrogenase FAD-binding subunit
MTYTAPTRLDEALEYLAERSAIPVAGATDFYPARVGQAIHDDVLDITAIAELRGIDITDRSIRIGALTTWREIQDARLPTSCSALVAAAGDIGGIQVQNVATIGGNLCNASPAADGAPPLLVLDAEVELASVRGTRQLPLQEFLVGYRATAMEPGELVTSIHIPTSGLEGRTSFLKLGSRTNLVISIAMVAARLVVSPDGTIQLARLAVGACSPTAVRLEVLEQSLIGESATRISDLVQREHLAPLNPIDDIRAPASYRLDAAHVLIERALARCRP